MISGLWLLVVFPVAALFFAWGRAETRSQTSHGVKIRTLEALVDYQKDLVMNAMTDRSRLSERIACCEEFAQRHMVPACVVENGESSTKE